MSSGRMRMRPPEPCRRRERLGGWWICPSGHQAEAQPGAIHQPPAVELSDADAAAGAGSLYFGGAFDALQYRLAGAGAGAVVVGVMADGPAAIPVTVASGGGAAVGVVGQLVDGDLAAAFDGFGIGKTAWSAGIPWHRAINASFRYLGKGWACQGCENSNDATTTISSMYVKPCIIGRGACMACGGVRWSCAMVVPRGAQQVSEPFLRTMRPPRTAQRVAALASLASLAVGHEPRSDRRAWSLLHRWDCIPSGRRRCCRCCWSGDRQPWGCGDLQVALIWSVSGYAGVLGTGCCWRQKNAPAAAPLRVSVGRGVQAPAVGAFDDDDIAAAFDGFQNPRSRWRMSGFGRVSDAPAFNQRRKAGACQGCQHGDDGYDHHQLYGGARGWRVTHSSGGAPLAWK